MKLYLKIMNLIYVFFEIRIQAMLIYFPFKLGNSKL